MADPLALPSSGFADHAPVRPPASGPVLFPRYAYGPNRFGYCGPDDADELLEAGAAGQDRVLRALAQRFEGAYPYLALIARSAGIADPLDRRVVEAYWLGSDLLRAVAVSAFGASIDEASELRERPDASIESITIKTVNPNGLILYRQLDISIVIHRPEALAVVPTERDGWQDLITPGAVFAMRYGWTANSKHVKNPILNGDSETVFVGGKAYPIQGNKVIRFAITNYRFTILPDQQINVNISALEDGDYSLRHTYVVPGIRPSLSKNNLVVTNDAEFRVDFTKNADKKIKDLTQDLRERIIPGQFGNVVRMEDIFDVFFVKQAEASILDLGYESIKFFMGTCNVRVPTPHKQYDWKKRNNRETPARYIGDFTVPFDAVIAQMSQLVNNGHELTLFNFITPFLRILNDPTVWSDLERPDVTMPEVQMRVIPYHNLSTGKQRAEIYVFDAKAELIRFTTDDKISYQDWAKKNSTSQAGVPNRDKIREICLNHGIPYVEFMKGNSWIQDAQFDVIQDELISSILITRYMRRDHFADTSKGANQVKDEEMDYRKVLYSSAIKGQLTTIGNHAMDVMGVYWMDFGIPQWSGPFRILERTDLIQMGGWQTTVSLISEGTDPLGSQGRPQQ